MGMTKKLENHRVFPIVAWFLIVGFASFVLLLVYSVQQQAEILGERQATNVSALEDL